MEPAAERDELIMAEVAAGEAGALEVLVRRHAGPLLTFIRRMVGDAHRSEELFQEIFLAVWTRRHQYSFPRPFKPWLYAIALNRCRAEFRGRSRRAQRVVLGLVEEPAGADPGSPADGLIARETAAQVEDAITRLPPRQRAVVALRVWQDLPYAQIGALLGLTEPTVRSHMHHGLAALRRDLEPLLDRAATP